MIQDLNNQLSFGCPCRPLQRILISQIALPRLPDTSFFSQDTVSWTKSRLELRLQSDSIARDSTTSRSILQQSYYGFLSLLSPLAISSHATQQDRLTNWRLYQFKALNWGRFAGRCYVGKWEGVGLKGRIELHTTTRKERREKSFIDST